MPTKAEWFRYHEERSGPKKQKRPVPPRRDVPVDTAKPGTSATDQKVGHGLTARRNFSRRSAETAPYVLEESATGKPSRKSTRKSINRSKPSHPLSQSKRFERLRETASRSATKERL